VVVLKVRSSRCRVAECTASLVEHEWLASDTLAAVSALESSMAEFHSGAAFAGGIEPASLPKKDAAGSRLVSTEPPALGLACHGVAGTEDHVVAVRNAHAGDCPPVDPGCSRRRVIVRGTVGGLRMLLPL
jgi:hypothetical protein